MDLIGIGAAASQLGLNTSTLRYYEERGLVRPAARYGGRRMYGPEQMRRLAFIQIVQRLGLSLDTARAVLDDPGDRWRAVVAEQIDVLQDLIRRAQEARETLQHALDCPADHPVEECPYLIETLDRRLTCAQPEQLASDRAVSPSRRPAGRRIKGPTTGATGETDIRGKRGRPPHRQRFGRR